MEYASPVWNPLLVKGINIIENVQRTFTRNVCALCNLPAMSYDERLSLFGLERLELRRLHCDLLELFKIAKRYTISDLFNCLSFNRNTNNHNTTGHCFKFNVTLYHKKVFKSFLTNRIVNIWNNLHNDCFNSDLISSFKSKLLLIDFTNSLRGRL